MSRAALCLITFAFLSPSLVAGQAITIHVNADAKLGPWRPIWRYFGYDEPNYTSMRYGKQLLAELAGLSSEPVYIRAHNLLTSGNGAPALKWGSTNAYTEDAAGRPIYDWTILDRIFDAYRDAGVKPFVEIGFMPQALSLHPEPYQHNWPKGPLGTGWSYPPKDYGKWAELVYQWVRHTVERYGRNEVDAWYWEVWNEPDIFYWHGTPEEYLKLYDFTADAVKRALPTARIGGPATTSPSATRAADYLRQFLEHCNTGKNYATGSTGCTLDFVTYHAKGRVSVVDQHVRMDIAKQTADVQKGIEIVSAFPKFRNLPIVLSESDPEGCAACSTRLHPENSYRNGPLYAAYTAAMLNNVVELAGQNGSHIEGMLNWAFEFEGQPYFEGFRTLATNGVDKPILNFFRMAGLLHGERVKVSSSGYTPAEPSELGTADVNALAVKSDHELSVMTWNYRGDDVAAPPAEVTVQLEGLPSTVTRALLTHYRIDRTHSNAYALWQQFGSPQNPTPEQYSALIAAGQLQNLGSPRWVSVRQAKAEIHLELPPQAVSLLQLSW